MSQVINETRAQAEIRAVLESWADATRKIEVDRVLSLYEPGIRAFDAIGPLQFRTVETYGPHWHACMAGVEGQMIFEHAELEIEADGSLGVASFLARCGCTDDEGKEQAGWMRGTVALRKGADGWRIYHEHYSNPFDPATLKASADLEP